MILATNNKNKLKEIREIFNEYNIYSLKDKSIDIDIIEDKDTFLDNAKKKAMEIYAISHEETIADDSGLCIKCLNGFPGVMTHRFLGENVSDNMRNNYLINEVNKYNDRTACVICNLVYYNGTDLITSEGILYGSISKNCRGKNGFGFDEIFELPNGITLAELTENKKNEISARSLAAKRLKAKINNLKNNS